METTPFEKKTNPPSIQRIVGIILLLPPLLSVLFFLVSVFGIAEDSRSIPQLGKLESNWTGSYGYSENGGGGFDSTVTIYFGLMAIAGAVLLATDRRVPIRIKDIGQVEEQL
jgi:hypothetical protein